MTNVTARWNLNDSTTNGWFSNHDMMFYDSLCLLLPLQLPELYHLSVQRAPTLQDEITEPRKRGPIWESRPQG